MSPGDPNLDFSLVCIFECAPVLKYEVVMEEQECEDEQIDEY